MMCLCLLNIIYLSANTMNREKRECQLFRTNSHSLEEQKFNLAEFIYLSISLF